MNDIKKTFCAFESGETFTAFDTETTGLNPENARVIEIGAIQFNKYGVITTYETLINPKTPIPWQITKINNITDQMVANKATFVEIAPEFLAFIKNTKLIAHNANFDIHFINAELDRAKIQKLCSPAIPAVDTVKLAQKSFPQLKCHKLQYLAETFNIDRGNAHRATDDARVCMNVFFKCLQAFKKAHPELVEIQPSLF
ncbi:MAG TPA: 3'-5' exonuclease [Treponemataceae bacterium]|nr:3'-5' exonuclease [Treponemataceae bacterium]